MCRSTEFKSILICAAELVLLCNTYEELIMALIIIQGSNTTNQQWPANQAPSQDLIMTKTDIIFICIANQN